MMLRRRCRAPAGQTSGMTSAAAPANQPARAFLIHIRNIRVGILFCYGGWPVSLQKLFILFMRNTERDTMASY